MSYKRNNENVEFYCVHINCYIITSYLVKIRACFRISWFYTQIVKRNSQQESFLIICLTNANSYLVAQENMAACKQGRQKR